MQKGGLVDNKKLQREIARQIAIEQAQQIIDRAFNRCLEEIVNYLPHEHFTDNQRNELCEFIVENREKLGEMGYDTHKFLSMFQEMMNKIIENEGINTEKAFLVVFNASKRFVQ